MIYNPIDVSKWTRNDVRYVENTVLYVGTVAEAKGVKDLIEACALLRRRGIAVELKIAGKIGGSFAIELQKYVQENHFIWCTFLGNVNRERLQHEYARSKISCFPSWWENLPFVCLEAMLAGNIVIGSSRGGMSEIISDEVDGFLIEPQNVPLMANKIEEALAMDENSVEQMRANARKKIESRFSMDAVLENMEKYYSNVITNFNDEKTSLG